ncbi:hypothetical protein [Bartonella sp. DGB2]|uniref:hypothetical protein n=1 Tax=Bartonella sp. DGB2 TaxID=3388426 RepID=UPI00398FC609
MTDLNFYKPVRSLTVGEIADRSGAQLLHGAPSQLILDITTLQNARPGALIFLPAIFAQEDGRCLEDSSASALVCEDGVTLSTPPSMAILQINNAKRAFFKVARLLFEPSATVETPFVLQGGGAGYVDVSARLEDNVQIEAGAVIGKDVEIGSGTIVGPGAVIEDGCCIGRNCRIGEGARLRYTYIGNRVIIHSGVYIGGSQARFLPTDHKQQAHGILSEDRLKNSWFPLVEDNGIFLGRVIIQDYVEIGAGSVIERGGLPDTVIGEGCRIGALTHIASNVFMGRACLIGSECVILANTYLDSATYMVNKEQRSSASFTGF